MVQFVSILVDGFFLDFFNSAASFPIEPLCDGNQMAANFDSFIVKCPIFKASLQLS